MNSEDVLPKFAYRRFHPAIRVIALILVVTFLAQDIVWAHPDPFVVKSVQKETLAPQSIFREPSEESIGRYHSAYVYELVKKAAEASGIRMNKLTLNSVRVVLRKLKDEPWLKITEPADTEILVSFEGGNLLRFYDPAKTERLKYNNQIISEEPQTEDAGDDTSLGIQFLKTGSLPRPTLNDVAISAKSEYRFDDHQIDLIKEFLAQRWGTNLITFIEILLGKLPDVVCNTIDAVWKETLSYQASKASKYKLPDEPDVTGMDAVARSFAYAKYYLAVDNVVVDTSKDQSVFMKRADGITKKYELSVWYGHLFMNGTTLPWCLQNAVGGHAKSLVNAKNILSECKDEMGAMKQIAECDPAIEAAKDQHKATIEDPVTKDKIIYHFIRKMFVENKDAARNFSIFKACVAKMEVALAKIEEGIDEAMKAAESAAAPSDIPEGSAINRLIKMRQYYGNDILTKEWMAEDLIAAGICKKKDGKTNLSLYTVKLELRQLRQFGVLEIAPGASPYIYRIRSEVHNMSPPGRGMDMINAIISLLKDLRRDREYHEIASYRISFSARQGIRRKIDRLISTFAKPAVAAPEKKTAQAGQAKYPILEELSALLSGRQTRIIPNPKFKLSPVAKSARKMPNLVMGRTDALALADELEKIADKLRTDISYIYLISSIDDWFLERCMKDFTRGARILSESAVLMHKNADGINLFDLEEIHRNLANAYAYLKCGYQLADHVDKNAARLNPPTKNNIMTLYRDIFGRSGREDGIIMTIEEMMREDILRVIRPKQYGALEILSQMEMAAFDTHGNSKTYQRWSLCHLRPNRDPFTSGLYDKLLTSLMPTEVCNGLPGAIPAAVDTRYVLALADHADLMGSLLKEAGALRNNELTRNAVELSQLFGAWKRDSGMSMMPEYLISAYYARAYLGVYENFIERLRNGGLSRVELKHLAKIFRARSNGIRLLAIRGNPRGEDVDACHRKIIGLRPEILQLSNRIRPSTPNNQLLAPSGLSSPAEYLDRTLKGMLGDQSDIGSISKAARAVLRMKNGSDKGDAGGLRKGILLSIKRPVIGLLGWIGMVRAFGWERVNRIYSDLLGPAIEEAIFTALPVALLFTFGIGEPIPILLLSRGVFIAWHLWEAYRESAEKKYFDLAGAIAIPAIMSAFIVRLIAESAPIGVCSSFLIGVTIHSPANALITPLLNWILRKMNSTITLRMAILGGERGDHIKSHGAWHVVFRPHIKLLREIEAELAAGGTITEEEARMAANSAKVFAANAPKIMRIPARHIRGANSTIENIGYNATLSLSNIVSLYSRNGRADPVGWQLASESVIALSQLKMNDDPRIDFAVSRFVDIVTDTRFSVDARNAAADVVIRYLSRGPKDDSGGQGLLEAHEVMRLCRVKLASVRSNLESEGVPAEQLAPIDKVLRYIDGKDKGGIVIPPMLMAIPFISRVLPWLEDLYYTFDPIRWRQLAFLAADGIIFWQIGNNAIGWAVFLGALPFIFYDVTDMLQEATFGRMYEWFHNGYQDWMEWPISPYKRDPKPGDPDEVKVGESVTLQNAPAPRTSRKLGEPHHLMSTMLDPLFPDLDDIATGTKTPVARPFQNRMMQFIAYVSRQPTDKATQKIILEDFQKQFMRDNASIEIDGRFTSHAARSSALRATKKAHDITYSVLGEMNESLREKGIDIRFTRTIFKYDPDDRTLAEIIPNETYGHGNERKIIINVAEVVRQRSTPMRNRIEYAMAFVAGEYLLGYLFEDGSVDRRVDEMMRFKNDLKNGSAHTRIAGLHFNLKKYDPIDEKHIFALRDAIINWFICSCVSPDVAKDNIEEEFAIYLREVRSEEDIYHLDMYKLAMYAAIAERVGVEPLDALYEVNAFLNKDGKRFRRDLRYFLNGLSLAPPKVRRTNHPDEAAPGNGIKYYYKTPPRDEDAEKLARAKKKSRMATHEMSSAADAHAEIIPPKQQLAVAAPNPSPAKKLADYIYDHNYSSERQFADFIGISHTTMHNILKGVTNFVFAATMKKFRDKGIDLEEFAFREWHNPSHVEGIPVPVSAEVTTKATAIPVSQRTRDLVLKVLQNALGKVTIDEMFKELRPKGVKKADILRLFEDDSEFSKHYNYDPSADEDTKASSAAYVEVRKYFIKAEHHLGWQEFGMAMSAAASGLALTKKQAAEGPDGMGELINEANLLVADIYSVLIEYLMSASIDIDTKERKLRELITEKATALYEARRKDVSSPFSTSDYKYIEEELAAYCRQLFDRIQSGLSDAELPKYIKHLARWTVVMNEQAQAFLATLQKDIHDTKDAANPPDAREAVSIKDYLDGSVIRTVFAAGHDNKEWIEEAKKEGQPWLTKDTVFLEYNGEKPSLPQGGSVDLVHESFLRDLTTARSDDTSRFEKYDRSLKSGGYFIFSHSGALVKPGQFTGWLDKKRYTYHVYDHVPADYPLTTTRQKIGDEHAYVIIARKMQQGRDGNIAAGGEPVSYWVECARQLTPETFAKFADDLKMDVAMLSDTAGLAEIRAALPMSVLILFNKMMAGPSVILQGDALPQEPSQPAPTQRKLSMPSAQSREEKVSSSLRRLTATFRVQMDNMRQCIRETGDSKEGKIIENARKRIAMAAHRITRHIKTEFSDPSLEEVRQFIQDATQDYRYLDTFVGSPGWVDTISEILAGIEKTLVGYEELAEKHQLTAHIEALEEARELEEMGKGVPSENVPDIAAPAPAAPQPAQILDDACRSHLISLAERDEKLLATIDARNVLKKECSSMQRLFDAIPSDAPRKGAALKSLTHRMKALEAAEQDVARQANKIRIIAQDSGAIRNEIYKRAAGRLILKERHYNRSLTRNVFENMRLLFELTEDKKAANIAEEICNGMTSFPGRRDEASREGVIAEAMKITKDELAARASGAPIIPVSEAAPNVQKTGNYEAAPNDVSDRRRRFYYLKTPQDDQHEAAVKRKSKARGEKWGAYYRIVEELPGLSDDVVSRLKNEPSFGGRKKILIEAGLGMVADINGKFLVTALEKFLKTRAVAPAPRNISNSLRRWYEGRHLVPFVGVDENFEYIMKTYANPATKKTVLVKWLEDGYASAEKRLNGLAVPTLVINATKGDRKEFVYFAEGMGRQTTDVAIIQPKLTPVKEIIKAHVQAGRLKEAEKLMDEYKKIFILIFRRGCIDLDFGDPLGNYGFDPSTGNIYISDLGEILAGVDSAYGFTDDLSYINEYIEVTLRDEIGPEIASYFHANPFKEGDFYGEDGQYLFGVDYNEDDVVSFKMKFPYTEEQARAIFLGQPETIQTTGDGKKPNAQGNPKPAIVSQKSSELPPLMGGMANTDTVAQWISDANAGDTDAVEKLIAQIKAMKPEDRPQEITAISAQLTNATARGRFVDATQNAITEKTNISGAEVTISPERVREGEDAVIDVEFPERQPKEPFLHVGVNGWKYPPHDLWQNLTPLPGPNGLPVYKFKVTDESGRKFSLTLKTRPGIRAIDFVVIIGHDWIKDGKDNFRIEVERRYTDYNQASITFFKDPSVKERIRAGEWLLQQPELSDESILRNKNSNNVIIFLSTLTQDSYNSELDRISAEAVLRVVENTDSEDDRNLLLERLITVVNSDSGRYDRDLQIAVIDRFVRVIDEGLMSEDSLGFWARRLGIPAREGTLMGFIMNRRREIAKKISKIRDGSQPEPEPVPAVSSDLSQAPAPQLATPPASVAIEPVPTVMTTAPVVAVAEPYRPPTPEVAQLQAPTPVAPAIPAEASVKETGVYNVIDSIDKLFKEVNVRNGATVLLSENLFIENGDRTELESEIKIALKQALDNGAIAILSPEEIRTRVKRNPSKDKLAVILSKGDYEDGGIWKSDNERMTTHASILILDDKLTGSNYLYLQGVVGLARAIMANNKQAITYYYNILSGMIIGTDILALLSEDSWNNIAFAIKAILKFRELGKMNPDELRTNRIKMETLLIAA